MSDVYYDIFVLCTIFFIYGGNKRIYPAGIIYEISSVHVHCSVRTCNNNDNSTSYVTDSSIRPTFSASSFLANIWNVKTLHISCLHQTHSSCGSQNPRGFPCDRGHQLVFNTMCFYMPKYTILWPEIISLWTVPSKLGLIFGNNSCPFFSARTTESPYSIYR